MSERYPGEGNGNSLQYSCLDNLMDRGAWQATVYGVTRVGHDSATKPPTTCMKCSLGSLYFLEEIVSFLFCCFPTFLCIDSLGRLSYLSLLFFGTLHSNGYSFPFSLLLTPLLVLAICKASSDNHFAFLHLFFWWMVLIMAFSCTMSQTSVHSSSGTLSTKSNPLNLFALLLYNFKGFDLGHTWMTQ